MLQKLNFTKLELFEIWIYKFEIEKFNNLKLIPKPKI